MYGEAIVDFLRQMPEELWSSYMLMEEITPPSLHNFMMTIRGLYEGSVISELGVFGVCLWRRRKEGKVEMIQELPLSWSLRTKDASVDEISVVKGYGCFDSPALVDWEVFMSVVNA